MSKVVKLIIIILLIIVAISAIIFGIYKYKEYIDDKNAGVKLATINKYNYFVYKSEEGLSGVIDNQGNIVLNAKFDNVKIPNPTIDVFACYEGDKIVMENSKGEILYQNYSSVEPIKLKNISTDLMYEKTVLKYEQDGKYGLIDYSGNKITENVYDSIDNLQYREGYLVIEQNGKYGIINIEGKVLVEPKYDQVKSDEFESDANKYKYSGYIVSVKEDDGYKYGYVNYKGETVLDTKYNDLLRFSIKSDEKIAYILAADNGKYGLFKNNKQIINCDYQDIEYQESANVFIVQKAKEYGVANIKGKFVVDVNYDDIQVNGIYIYAKKDDNTTVYDEKGKAQNISSTNQLYKVANGEYYITIDNTDNGTLYGILDKNKKELVNEQYMYIEYAFDNYFIVSTKDGYGVISSDGTVKIAPQNSSVQKISGKNVLQILEDNSSKTEIYSRDMTKVCEMDNGKIDTEDSYIKIYSATDFEYLDNNGNKIDALSINPNNTLFANSNNGLWGFADKNGKKVIDNKYQRVTDFNQYGFAAIENNGLWGSIDSNGKIIVDTKYKMSQGVLEADFIGKYYKVEYGLGEFYYTDRVIK